MIASLIFNNNNNHNTQIAYYDYTTHSALEAFAKHWKYTNNVFINLVKDNKMQIINSNNKLAQG